MIASARYSDEFTVTVSCDGGSLTWTAYHHEQSVSHTVRDERLLTVEGSPSGVEIIASASSVWLSEVISGTQSRMAWRRR